MTEINKEKIAASVKSYLAQNTPIDYEESKYNEFKNQLKVFDNVTEIKKAKEIAKEFLPIENETNYLKIGNAKCVIISRNDTFRICLDNEHEFICYNIIKK